MQQACIAAGVILIRNSQPELIAQPRVVKTNFLRTKFSISICAADVCTFSRIMQFQKFLLSERVALHR